MADAITFDDGAVYERFMGTWSRMVGSVFLDWLSPPASLRWLDVGCGNGALTDLIATRCEPRELLGIDPSGQQLAFARGRVEGSGVRFAEGSAMALPCDDATFDIAVMGLVIFFVPDPAKGVAEMVRAVRDGGVVASYAWDTEAGGFTNEPIFEQLRPRGLPIPMPPRIEAGGMEAARRLWAEAGLVDVETRQIPVERTFENFDGYWSAATGGPGMGPLFQAMAPALVKEIKDAVRSRHPENAGGSFTTRARANAIRGIVRK